MTCSTSYCLCDTLMDPWNLCTYLCMYICMYVCTYVHMYVFMYLLCMYVYVCIYVCIMHVCMCVYVCMYVCMQRFNSFGIWRHVKLTNNSWYFQEIWCLNVQALSSKDLQNICNYLLWTMHHILEDLNLQHGPCMKNFNIVMINNGLLWFDMLDIKCHKL